MGADAGCPASRGPLIAEIPTSAPTARAGRRREHEPVRAARPSRVVLAAALAMIAGVACRGPASREAPDSPPVVLGEEPGAERSEPGDPGSEDTEPGDPGSEDTEPGDPQTRGRILFAGNRVVETSTFRSVLADEIERVQERGFRKSGIDDLAFETERYLRSRGYAFARVDYRYEEDEAVLSIDEGPFVRLREVTFTGNRAVASSRLAGLLPKRYTGLLDTGDRIFVERDVDGLPGAVAEVYRERGYADVEVDRPEITYGGKRDRATVHVTLREGPRYEVDRIEILDVPELERDAVDSRLVDFPGTAYVPRLRLEVATAVESMYTRSGYASARVQVVDRIDRAGATAERVPVVLSVSADPGPLVTIGKVKILGNERTKRGFLRRRIKIEEGDRYNAEDVRRAFSALFETGIFRTVDIRLDGDRDDEVRDLVVEVFERPSLETFFELGWGSYDRARGKVGVRERNLFGRGITGRAEVLGSTRGYALTLGLTDPWFFGTPLTADAPITFLERDEPSYRIREGKLRFRLFRQITRTIEGGVAYRFSLSEVERQRVEDEPEIEEGRLRVGAAGPFVEYDTRDDFFSPTRGLRTRTFVELGSPGFGGELNFVQTGGAISAFHSFFDWIVPFNDTEFIPIQERLFLGGENGVRSFRQSEVGEKDVDGDPIGGEVRNFASVELRQRLLGPLDGAAFFDYGNVARTADNPFENFRPGLGFGLRYALPIGPIRLDAAWNPDRDRSQDEDAWVIHFAVGMPY